MITTEEDIAKIVREDGKRCWSISDIDYQSMLLLRMAKELSVPDDAIRFCILNNLKLPQIINVIGLYGDGDYCRVDLSRIILSKEQQEEIFKSARDGISPRLMKFYAKHEISASCMRVARIASVTGIFLELIGCMIDTYQNLSYVEIIDKLTHLLDNIQEIENPLVIEGIITKTEFKSQIYTLLLRFIDDTQQVIGPDSLSNQKKVILDKMYHDKTMLSITETE